MRYVLASILLLGSAALSAAAADEPEAYCLKLRPQATVYGGNVTLGDVLVLAQVEPELAQRIGQQPAVAQAAGGPKTTVTHKQVVSRLSELGVNLARVLVGGALRCEVTFRDRSGQQTGATMTADAEQQAPLWRAPQTPGVGGQRSLADVLRAHVNKELAETGGTAELQFEHAGGEFLQLTTPPWEFSISSSGADKLGLRQFRVLIRRDGRVQRTAHVFAQVRLRRQTVVASRPLSVGNFVRREDVGFETRVFADDDELGLTGLEQVVGQQVKRFVPSGEMVGADDLKNVDLVRRSRPVTILNDKSNIRIRLTGTALDSGGYGDTVRVRVGDSRRNRQMLRGVVTGLGTVRIAEGQRQ